MRDKLRAYYLPLLTRHGPTAQGVGWANAQTQDRRYRILLDVDAAPRIATGAILEVGCGAGWIVPQLSALQRTVNKPGAYLGIDALPEMVREASQGWPGWFFEVNDVRQGGFNSHYVIASGIFALSEWGELTATVVAMWRACRIAVAFNFLTDGDGLGPETHFDPFDVLRECRKHTPWCTLRMDYHLRDATVYMYREARA